MINSFLPRDNKNIKEKIREILNIFTIQWFRSGIGTERVIP